MKNYVSKEEVMDFKSLWCNENSIIIDLIRTKVQDYFIAPILDVGTGLGDIPYHALADKEVICIDVNELQSGLYPLRNGHSREVINFFHYTQSKKINTIFICHTLQFLDSDIELLNRKISELLPQNIITVTNNNDDFMGEIIEWVTNNCDSSNPELIIPEFPIGYKMINYFCFNARIECVSFEELVKQIAYLTLIQLNKENNNKLLEFLKDKLEFPKFQFKQTIKIYGRK